MKSLNLFTLVLFLTQPLWGQVLFGELRGRVTAGNAPLPGVTVQLTWVDLEMARTTVTGASGDYVLRGLLPGPASVTFSLEGFRTVGREVTISAARTIEISPSLEPAALSETITVEAPVESISENAESATTFDRELLEALPLERTIGRAAALTAGVGEAEGGLFTISGAPTFEGSFRVNGVVVDDNVRRQPIDLYVEDALQEATVLTSGISAEYGRFAGGVVNAVTRSGSNTFDGSLRDTLTNEDWSSGTPLSVEPLDEVNDRWEATFGGPVDRDHVWFFLAGRDREIESSRQLVIVGEPYVLGDKEQRWEGKLTIAPAASHLLQGSYLGIGQDRSNVGRAADPDALYSQNFRHTLVNVNYSSLWGDRVHLEAQYGRRDLAIDGGHPFTDRIRGTPISAGGANINAGSFCGPCPDERRDNENYFVKGSMLVSSPRIGTHDIVAGYEGFEDFIRVSAHQTASDFFIFAGGFSVGDQGVYYPVFAPFQTILFYQPVLEESHGTRLETKSFFIHDSWSAGRWLFDLGARWDRNEGRNGSGDPIADDSALSPRLGVAFDPLANGSWNLHASWSQYVAALAGPIGGQSSAAGLPSGFAYIYAGNPVNLVEPSLPADQALEVLFEWFDSVGGTSPGNPFLIFGETASAFNIDSDLSSPHSDELTFGVTRTWHNGRFLLRADYVRRSYEDAYVRRVDLGTGTVIDEANGVTLDRIILENDSNLLERNYDGLHIQGRGRLGERISLGASWTWSHTRGNVDGESFSTGPLASDVLAYPEYRSLSWSNPEGDLSTDRRNTARIWAVFDLWRSARHSLGLGWVDSYADGRPYGAVQVVDPTPYVDNPGYELPPTSVPYYFTPRDTFRTDDVHSTDLSLNYELRLMARNREVTLLAQPEIVNVFDEDAVVGVSTRVETAQTSSQLEPFDPFTESPVEGVHWSRGNSFGEPELPQDYQQPRTFRISLAVRF